MGKRSSKRVCFTQWYALGEALERRVMLSAAPVVARPVGLKAIAVGQSAYHGPPRTPFRGMAHPIAVMGNVTPNNVTPPGTAMTPSVMRHAYGVDQVMFGSVTGDGAGQTIAIIDAYHYPTAAADLHAFDVQFGLADPPSFTQVSQSGGSAAGVPTDPVGAGYSKGTWEQEEALDVQWSHAMAPKANLILVEANSPGWVDLILNAVGWRGRKRWPRYR